MDKETKKENKNMLMVLNSYKLTVPTAETKVMPQGLRKEVRDYVRTYVGNFSRELKRIKSMKKDTFLKKHELKLRGEILSTEDVVNKIKEFNNLFVSFKDIYNKCNSDERLDVSKEIWEFDENKEIFTVKVKDSFVNNELYNNFIELYGEGFKKFEDVLEKFEKTIEKTILFGTVTDVYKLIDNYDKFTPYLTKLSELKIK